MTKNIKISISLVAIIFSYHLYNTLTNFSILKAFETHESAKRWLLVTIFDYYVQTLAFSIIVIHSEKKKTSAALWVFLNCVLGSPIAILYLVTKNNWSLKESEK